MRKCALVFGGTGFIGSHLIDALCADGYEVHVVGRNSVRGEYIPKEATFHALDIADREAVFSLFQTVMPNEVYHLAMSPLQMGRTEGARSLVETNILGTANIMDALSETPDAHLVYTGSFTEVGGHNEPVREDHAPEPPELYSVTKLSGTLYGQALARYQNRNVVTGRIFTPYGPRIQKGRLIDVVLRSMLANENLELTAPSVGRDFVYVDDIVLALRELAARAKELRGEVFNIGTGIHTTLESLVSVIRGETGSTSSISWSPEKQVSYDAYPWQADMKKVESVLTWRPTVPLREGLSRTIAWLRS